MNTLNRIHELKETGQFHHATARMQGQYSYFYIYRKEDNGFNGFRLDCSISNWPHEAEEFKAVDGVLSGIHVGHYNGG